ncbi:HEAT repeat domain-containing protein [Dehalococcoides mccartyi]|uniref:HEAT repeat domain-containing protein n=1 Tax=Dehalococcoides mccartyi TaxID=61435 RepID=UPI00107EA426|nr:HEAT repeat domain-containing protein [Dehalococcoides mccartyi]MBA2085248.1 hypothetical protein [Dehalococcoides mccartyi]QBX63963.1 HEAT repeat domain-containing protein [Dehalococcoides mccartyi]BCT56019.1 hypothetical protein DHCNIT_0007820 [Dehalococcoides mccartyi]BEL00964.1 hypothetical protein DMOBY_08170 [Dehalococcoides mccartyi]
MGIFKQKQDKFYKILSDTLENGNDAQKIASINALQDMCKLKLKIKDIFNNPHASNIVKEAATQFFKQAGDFYDIDALYNEIIDHPDSIDKPYIDAIEDILQRYYDQKTFRNNIRPQYLLTNMINTDSHIIKYTTLSIMKHLNLDEYYLTLQDLLDSEKLENTNLVVEILKDSGNIRSLLPLLKLMENIAFLSEDRADLESYGDSSKNNIYTLENLDQSISQYEVFEHKKKLYGRVLENTNNALDKISSKSLANANAIEESFINVLSSKYPLIRSTAAKVLGNLESDKSVDVLISLLEDTDESVTESAIEALGNIKNTSAIKPLANLLSNTTFSSQAAIALGQIGNPAALMQLIKTLNNCDDHTRRAIFFALGNIGDQEASKYLINLFEESKSYYFLTLYQYIETLGLLKINSASDYLINLLSHEHSDIRMQAAWALGYMKEPTALKHLEQMLTDNSENVRKTAAYSIKMIKENS